MQKPMSKEQVRKLSSGGLAAAGLVMAGYLGSSYLSKPSPGSWTEPSPIKIQVSGGVRKPGVYQLTKDARVADAIKAAGGATKLAILSDLNQGARILDAVPLVVPTEESVDSLPTDSPYRISAAPETVAKVGAEPAPGQISLNQATQEELETLPRIGPALAKRIIEYRQKNQGFKSIDDLNNVKGIGEKTMGLLRPFLQL